MTGLTVLVPAHNEEAQIEDTLRSLLAQTSAPDKIVVVCDNCTDNTFVIAHLFAQSFPTVVACETAGNKFRKSGALVQAWELFAQDAEYVFTMDADTVLAPNFFELSLRLMDERPELGGACACPMLKDTPDGLSHWEDFLWRMGKIDFGGYMRILCRWKFKPEVLFGYGTIFRNSALHDIAAAEGSPWDVRSIVEDYRASLVLRKMGWELAIIPGAFAYTDVPVTLRELWVQRLRWAGGTWQELARAGWHPYTRKVWFSAVGCVGSAVLRSLALIAWTLAIVLQMDLAVSWVWLIPILIGIVDRIDVTRYTQKSDWKDVLLVGTLLPLEIMSVLREAWTVWSAIIVSRKRHLSW